MVSKRLNSYFEFGFNFLRLPNSKCSQSQVISTILLILLAITAAGIIATFSINFVRNQLKGTSCIEIVDQIRIENNPRFTCYKNDPDPSLKELKVQVHFSDNKDIEGFKLEIGTPEGSSKTFEIKNNVNLDPDVKMYNGPNPPYNPLILPGKNTEKTYVVKWNSVSSANPLESTGSENYDIPISVYPILKGGKPCASGDSASEIPLCI